MTVRYEVSITERQGVEVMEAASITAGFFVYLLASLGGISKELMEKKVAALERNGEVTVIGGFLGNVQYTFTAKEITTSDKEVNDGSATISTPAESSREPRER